MMLGRLLRWVPTILAAMSSTSIAAEDAPICSITDRDHLPKLEARIYSDMSYFTAGRVGFACQMWQTFIYLNWPASSRRGEPDNGAKFGSDGATVWETYKTVKQVFLPNAADPGPWPNSARIPTLSKPLNEQVANGRLRRLTVKSKISPEVMANIARNEFITPDIVRDMEEVAKAVLYDLNGKPVFYEVALNQAKYDYVRSKRFYNAKAQVEFARKETIILPPESVTVKAAWKILSVTEIKSREFHTAQALIPGSQRPVTVGLIGLHIYQPLRATGQGAWATFAHVKNAPVMDDVIGDSYSFYDPLCNCPVNEPNRNPGQVMQIFPDEEEEKKVTRYMQDLIKADNPNSPWQHYKLVTVQWATAKKEVSELAKPVVIPLPDGAPNHPTAVNAVIETFKQKAKTNCLGCHQVATVARNKGTPAYAAFYSFTFGHAKPPR